MFLLLYAAILRPALTVSLLLKPLGQPAGYALAQPLVALYRRNIPGNRKFSARFVKILPVPAEARQKIRSTAMVSLDNRQDLRRVKRETRHLFHQVDDDARAAGMTQLHVAGNNKGSHAKPLTRERHPAAELFKRREPRLFMPVMVRKNFRRRKSLADIVHGGRKAGFSF